MVRKVSLVARKVAPPTASCGEIPKINQFEDDLAKLKVVGTNAKRPKMSG